MERPKADPILVTRWRQQPRQQQELIVQVTADMEQATARLAQRGIRVRRVLRLIHSAAVTCSGEQALSLLEQPWIERISPNASVKATQ